MGKTQTFLIVFVVVATMGMYSMLSINQPHEKMMFDAWKKIYGKKYADFNEQNHRFFTWFQNHIFVNEHNSKYIAGEESFQVEMNAFADLTTQQFAARYLMKNFQPNQQNHPILGKTNKCTGDQAPTDNLPDQIDWSAQGAVTEIKNQGQCGSCWSFSTTGSLQGLNYITTKNLLSFSEQQLVDCSWLYGNHGCFGGLMNYSFWYVIDHGITLEQKYPYHGYSISCKYNASTDKVWSIKDCTEVTAEVQLSLMAAIVQQPVSVAIQANQLSFQLYRGGVYTAKCGTKLDHGVLAVGYGVQKDKNYIKVKNSWGNTWGMHGYILMQRTGDGPGKCGMQLAPSFPLV